LAIIFLETPIN